MFFLRRKDSLENLEATILQAGDVMVFSTFMGEFWIERGDLVLVPKDDIFTRNTYFSFSEVQDADALRAICCLVASAAGGVKVGPMQEPTKTSNCFRFEFIDDAAKAA